MKAEFVPQQLIRMGISNQHDNIDYISYVRRKPVHHANMSM